jgi:hypothetical protein
VEARCITRLSLDTDGLLASSRGMRGDLCAAAIKVRIDVEVAGMPTLGIRLPPTTLIAHRKSRPVARAAAALCMDDEITRRFIVTRIHPGDVVILI